MKTYRFLLPIVIAAFAVLPMEGTLPAQDESTVSPDYLGQTKSVTDESSPIDSAMPDIAGTWRMDLSENATANYLFRIRRVTNGAADYQWEMLNVPDKDKKQYLIRWVPEARHFQGTMTDIPNGMKGIATITLKPDEDNTHLHFDTTLDEEAKKSVEGMKNEATAKGVPRNIVDKSFEQELHMKWKRNNDKGTANSVASKTKQPVPTSSDTDAAPQGSDSDPQPQSKTEKKRNEPAAGPQVGHSAKPSSMQPSIVKAKPEAAPPVNMLLSFSATWSPPCQEMSPIVSKLEHMGFPIRRVDIDAEKKLADQYHVETVPCFVLIANGREITRIKGLTDEEKLLRFMVTLLKQKRDDTAPGKIPVDEDSEAAQDVIGAGNRPPVITPGKETLDILLYETKDGLSAYSKSLEKWDRVTAPRPKDGQSRLSQSKISANFASVIIGYQLFAFSSQTGRWSVLKIPPETVGEVIPNHGPDILTVLIGDKVFVLSPKSGKWTSSDGEQVTATEPSGGYVNFLNPDEKVIGASNSADSRKLKEAIAEHDEMCVRLADQIRTLLKNKPEGENESPKQMELRQKLEANLSKAFDYKNQLEQLRVKELQARLSRLEQQIGQRQAQRTQIIARRGRELIEGDQTKWNAETVNTTQNVDATTQIVPQNPTTVPSSNASGLPRDPNATELQFSRVGPNSKLPCSIQIDGDDVPHLLPALLQFASDEKEVRSYKLRLKSSSLPEPGRELNQILKLEIYPLRPGENVYLRHLNPKFEITDGDVDSIASQNVPAIRIIYVKPNAKHKLVAETIVSKPSDPSFDPLAEARKRGSVIAVLHFPIASAAATLVPNQSHTTQVRFASKVARGAIEFQGHRRDFPARIDFERDDKVVRNYSLELVGDTLTGLARSLSLEIYPNHPNSATYLSHNSVPFEFTPEDFNPANSNIPSTRIVYLPNVKLPQLATVETIVSKPSDPSFDPLAEARKRGSLIAVLHFPIASATATLIPKQWPGSIDEAQVKAPRHTNPFGLAPGQKPLTYEELTTGLERVLDELDLAKYELHRQQELRKSGTITANDLAMARGKRDLAYYKFGNLRDDFLATVRDMELQMKAAQAELESALRISESYDRAPKGTIASDTVIASKLQLEQAHTSIKRLKARYETFKNAGERLVDGSVTNEPPSKLTFAVSEWGLRFASSPVDIQGQRRYRSGMRVLEADSPAAANGIQKGDILVALDKWETVSADNIVWIMNQATSQHAAPEGEKRIKFYLIRGDELKEGHLPLFPASRIPQQDGEPKDG